MTNRPAGRHLRILKLTALPALFLALAGAYAAQEQAPLKREFSVSGHKYAFEPARLEVTQDDLIKITFRAEDIPHSFTVDAYRIAKRAGAGQTVVFEFRADQAGSFPIYCSLTGDERCREMRGELVVKPRR